VWRAQSTTGVETYGLSRVSQGLEEEIVSLPFAPEYLAIVGEDLYGLGQSARTSDAHTATIVRISTVNHTAELIFNESRGPGHTTWFHTHRGRVLWSDYALDSPSKSDSKVYSIRGSTIALDPVIECAFLENAVLFDDVVAFGSDSTCAVPVNAIFGIVNLITGKLGHYIYTDQNGLTLYRATLVGYRQGWIYLGYDNMLIRVLPRPTQNQAAQSE
jgi:hypothetical protein